MCSESISVDNYNNEDHHITKGHKGYRGRNDLLHLKKKPRKSDRKMPNITPYFSFDCQENKHTDILLQGVFYFSTRK